MNDQPSNNLIYFVAMSVQGRDFFADLAQTLLHSLLSRGDLAGCNADVLIITTADIATKLTEHSHQPDEAQGKGVRYWLRDKPSETVHDACFERYRIFSHPEIKQYRRVIYLDTDIVVTSSLKPAFRAIRRSKKPLLALNEKGYRANHPGNYYGRELFEQSGHLDLLQKRSFSSGAMLLRRHPSVRRVFERTLNQFKARRAAGLSDYKLYDQALINYHALCAGIVSTKGAEQWICNNPNPNAPSSWRPICHFPGGVGNRNKVEKIAAFEQALQHTQSTAAPLRH